MGVLSELMGVLSAMMIWKTEKARRRVMPSESRSPQEGGSQKMMCVMMTMKRIGTRMWLT